MKKLLSCVLVLAFAVSMTACNVSVSTGSPNQPDSSSSQSGSKSESDSSSSQSGDASDSNSSGSSDSESSSSNSNGAKKLTPAEYKEFLKDYINPDHYNESTVDEDTYSITIKDEYKLEGSKDSSANRDSILNGDITVDNDTSVKLGMKYQKLLDQGWSYEDDSYKDKELSAYSSIMGPIMIKGGKELRNSAENKESSPQKYADVSVDGINIHYYEFNGDKNNKAVDFSLKGKVDNNTDLKSLIDTLGEPHIIYYSSGLERPYVTLTYNTSSCSYDFTFSSDGSEMTTLEADAF